MSTPRKGRAVVAVLLAALLAGLALAVLGEGRGEIGARLEGPGAGQDPRTDPSKVTRLGRTDPSATIDFSLVLRLRNAALEHFLTRQRDPASPQYGSSLDPQAFGRRFGPEPSQLAGARRALTSEGIEVTQSYPQRTTLRVRGRAADVTRVFGVALRDFTDGSGARWHAPGGPATVPPALRAAVREVAGLDSQPYPVDSLQQAPEEDPDIGPGDGLERTNLEAAYDIGPLHERGINGEGQTVAILGYQTFDESDVAQYDELTGTEGPPVEKVVLNGGSDPGDGSGEISLDIDVIRAVAPKAQVLSYEAPNNGTVSIGAVMDQIVADGRTDLVSISWGRCDIPENFAPGDREAGLQSFRAAAAQGVSAFIASGDAGAYDCQHSNINDDRVAVDFPSSSPDVITAGGTRLFVRENGTYLSEAGWEDVLSAGGGGGGLSPEDPRPEYQRAPGVENEFSNGMRQIPDVAAPADPDSGYLVVDEGEVGVTGGTSGAAPFWAGVMTLVRQYVAEEGGPEGLGFVNPILYEIARDEGAQSPFNDVVRGGNRLHNATPGWDYATGLGSPRVFELAQAFEERLNR